MLSIILCRKQFLAFKVGKFSFIKILNCIAILQKIKVGEIFLCLISINFPTHFARRGINQATLEPYKLLKTVISCNVTIACYDIFVWLGCRTQFTLIIFCCSPYKFFIRNVHCYIAATIRLDHRQNKKQTVNNAGLIQDINLWRFNRPNSKHGKNIVISLK